MMRRCPLYLTIMFAVGAIPETSASGTSGQNVAHVIQIERERDRRDWSAALALIEQDLATHPGDNALYRLRVLTLADLGANHRAWTLYRSRPEIFQADERARLEADQLARLIRWSHLHAADESARLDEARDANDALSHLRAQTRATSATIATNTDFDELILLNRLGRHREVVDRYQRFRTEGRETPTYVLSAIGGSLLAMRRPEEAAAVLERALAASPGDPELTVQLAYAQLERERFDLAEQLLTERVAALDPWPRAPGATRGHQNWQRYDVETSLALVRAFGENLAGAQAMLEPLAAVGPNNANLQSSLGSIYAYRGWLERALERYRVAATLDERSVTARIGQVETLNALRRADLARPIRDELVARFPTEPRVQTMDNGWRLNQGAGTRVYAAAGRSSGDVGASPFGNNDLHYGAEVQSQLLHDRWRLFAQSDHRRSDFHGERIGSHRTSAGLGYAFDRWEVSVLTGRDTDGIGGTAASLDAAWHADDRWIVRGSIARNSAGASLQARSADITADSASVTVEYRRDESMGWSASAQRLWYTDGNVRDAIGLAGSQRWISRPHLVITGVVDLSAGHGSHVDAPYFNPRRDASMELGVRADHLVWRRYDHHFRQRATLSMGPAWQQDFGTAWVPSVRYEHEWQFAPGRVLLYGLGWSRPVYDGQRESRLGLDAEFRWGE